MKVKVTNTREHAIHISIPESTDGVGGRETIPMAKQDPDDRTKLIHGEAIVDAEFLDVARKNKVVQHYFNEGWLRTDRPKPVAKDESEDSKPPAKPTK